MHLISICPVLASNSVLYIYKETLQTLQRNQKEAFREETL
jgi:hypothetical protein